MNDWTLRVPRRVRSTDKERENQKQQQRKSHLFQSRRASLAPSRQHESNKSGEVAAERRRGRPGAQSRDLAQQDPRGRPAQPAVQHERLLLEAEGAGAQHPAEQEREQDGDPAARHRLHPGPADRARLALRHEQPAARTRRGQEPADHPQHGHQHPLPTDAGVSVRFDHRGQQDALPLIRCLVKT